MKNRKKYLGFLFLIFRFWSKILYFIRYLKKTSDLVNTLKSLNIQKSNSNVTLIKILDDLKNLA